MKKTFLCVLTVFLALCCFVGCDNPANSPNGGTDGKDDINDGNVETAKDWWIGTWYYEGKTTALIDNKSATGIFREIYEIENDKDWSYYIQYEDKYLVIASSFESDDNSTEYTYSFSQQKTPISHGKYKFREYEIEKGEGVYTYEDNSTSIFNGIIFTEYSTIEDFRLKLYLDNSIQKLVSPSFSTKEQNLIYSKMQ